MKQIVLLIFLFLSIFFSKDLQTFKLENGTKISGKLISEENDIFEVETEFGLVQIEKKDIKKYQCKVFMNDGNILVGSKISSSENELILDTDIGVFKVNKDDYFLCIPKIKSDIYFVLMFIIAIFK